MPRLRRLGLAAAAFGLVVSLTPQSGLRAQTAADRFGEKVDESPLITQPETPTERLRAALLLLKLTRADLAKEQLENIVAADLSAEQLLALRDEYGTGTFLRLARNKDLVPAGQQLLEQLSVAARSQASADGYVDELLEGLDGNRDDAQAALRELKRLGPKGVIAITERAGRDAGSDLRLEKALSLLGSRAVAPLTDVIAVSPREAERQLAVRTLARTAKVDQIPTLVAVAADATESVDLRQNATLGLERLSATSYLFDAAGTLRQAAVDLLEGQTRLPEDAEGNVLLFDIDLTRPSAEQRLTRQNISAINARKRLAIRALEAALRIDPDDREALKFAYVLRLDSSGAAAVQDELFRRGPAAASEVLELALALDLPQPAVAALEVIGTSGRADSFAALSPAAQALNAAQPEVQFAAARAAIHVTPTKAFPNSSRVVEILASKLTSDGTPKVVVVDPNERRGADMAGRLQQIGFGPLLTDSGREGFRVAASRDDVVLAVVHANSTNWELTPTVANFDADSRTTAIPMAVVASTQARESLNWIRSQHPDLLYVPVQSDTDGLRQALKPALAQISESANPATDDVRKEAVRLLNEIAVRRLTDIFPLASAAEGLMEASRDENEAIARAAVNTLAYLPATEAQVELADVVVTAPSPFVRRAAAQALVRHLARFGSSLSTSQAIRVIESDDDGDAVLRQSLSAAAGLLSK